METLLGPEQWPRALRVWSCLSGQLGAVGAMWDRGVVGDKRRSLLDFGSTSAVVCQTS